MMLMGNCIPCIQFVYFNHRNTILMRTAPEDSSSVAIENYRTFSSQGDFVIRLVSSSWTAEHILKLQSGTKSREGCPRSSNEVNNHITQQKIKENLIKIVGQKGEIGKEEGIFNLKDCALNKIALERKRKAYEH